MNEENNQRMEGLRIAAPIIIIALGAGGYFAMLALKKKPDKDEANDHRPAVVQTETVLPYRKELEIKVSGEVVPFRVVPVPTQVAGSIVKKHEICRAGNFVAKGEPLFEIDREDYRLAKEETAGALAELESEIETTGQLLALAKRSYEIQRRENERDKRLQGVTSPSDLDRSELALLTTETSMLTLQTQKRVLQSRRPRLTAAREKADLDFQRTWIQSPIEGVIVTDPVEQDEFVQRGTTMVTIEDTSVVEVKCNLRKEQNRWLWLSQQDQKDLPTDRKYLADSYQVPESDATITYLLRDASYSWSGKLTRYDGHGLDTDTRMYPCRVIVDKPRDVTVLSESETARAARPRALVQGMYVTVTIKVKSQQSRQSLWALPQKAIWPGKIVWLVRDGKLVKQPVEVVQQTGESAVVHAANAAFLKRDQVVTSPLEFPRNGLSVTTQVSGQRTTKKTEPQEKPTS